MTSHINDLSAPQSSNHFADLTQTQLPEALSRYSFCLPENKIAQTSVRDIKVGDCVRDCLDNWFGTVIEIYKTSPTGTIYVRVQPDNVLHLHRSDVVEHKGEHCVLPRDFGAHHARYVLAN